MKKLFLLITLIFFISCDTKNVKSETTDIMIDGRLFKIYEMDSCQWLGSSTLTSQTAILSHRGRCIYCQERRVKLIDSLIRVNK
jgi:hypothetical protein